MKRYLLMILVGLLASTGSLYGARCYRPAELPACPTPAFAPYCRITTDTAATVISCTLCHYEMWRHQA